MRGKRGIKEKKRGSKRSKRGIMGEWCHGNQGQGEDVKKEQDIDQFC